MLKELKEKAGKYSKEIRELANKQNETPDEWSAEDEQRWDKLNKDYDAVKAQIDKQVRAEEVEKHQNEVVTDEGLSRKDLASKEYSDHQEKNGQVSERDTALAMQGWCLARADMQDRITDEHREAAEKTGYRLDARNLDIPLEKRVDDYVSTVSGYGGQTVPEGFVNNFEIALKMFGGIRRHAQVLRTSTGNDMPWPTSNDTSNKGELLDEAADSDDSATSHGEVTTSSITLKAYKISSKMLQVSEELMTDSAFNFASYLGRFVGERIARKEAELFATGTGSSQHEGIVTGATSGKTAAAVDSLDADEIIDLIYSVDAAYRENGIFLMNDAIVKAIRKLKDGNGQYLWQPSNQAGEPDRLWGYPVETCSDMESSIATGNKVIVFGDLSKYIIRDVASVRMKRLVELKAEYDRECFVGFKRSDGHVLDAGTNPIKYLEMA